MIDQYPEELSYSESHVWVRLTDDNNVAIVGVTSHLLGNSKDILSVELTGTGEEMAAEEELGLLEFLDGSSQELYTPVSGELIAINEELEEAPKLIDTDPYGDGWLCKIKLSDPSELEELLSADEYKDFLYALEEE